VGIGDAENDYAFLSLCGFSVAVGNAIPSLKERVDLVTSGEAGAGVVEVLQKILASEDSMPGPARLRKETLTDNR
jgi:hydroxymethylpyrimidine pyrophosphatase-like HAD family hydrolase